MPGPTFACGGCGDLEGQGYDRSGFSSAGSSMIWTSMVIDRRYKIKLHRYPFAGSGVICNGVLFKTYAIPAKAEIHSANHWKCADDGLDSRLRGNDCA